VKVLGSLTSMPMFLNTTNPNIKTLKDFTEKDRIAMPTVKVSVQGVTLQMAAAKELGDNRWSALDKQTVAMSHPDGMTALLSGASGITAHFTAPPFQYQELDAAARETGKDGGPRPVHKVLSSYDVLGGKSTFVLVVSTEKFRKANPKTFDAMVKALGEAQKWINEHKKEAAELYLKASGSKEQLDDLLKQMNDPDIEFTVVPKNIGKYADFMHHVGSVKARPESWKDLCFENLHKEEGS
jgi:NitT/TauT family transport system substrate-binding protein